MPLSELLIKNQGWMKAWEAFIEHGRIERNWLREEVAYSWMRCKMHNVDPVNNKGSYVLSAEEFQKRYKENMALIQTAMPFMNSLREIVESSGFIVRLTDVDGFVLECIGDDKLLKHYGHLNIHRGCCMREDVIGTNALGTVLEIKQPIQIVGAEHYCKAYHDWASSACPIRGEKEELIGVLSTTGPVSNAHSHTLGMVVAAAQAIGKKMKIDKINKQLDVANKHFYAIMESISEGMICTDNRGYIMDINLFARKFLGLGEKQILGKNIDAILEKRDYERIRRRAKSRRKYAEEEVHLRNKKGQRVACIVTVTPILDRESNYVQGFVLIFKEAKMIHSLVNKIVGAEARFNFDDILGDSKQIKDAIQMGKLASTTDTTILLLGESGTGKELFAQAIHNESPRKKKPFVFLNCGAIPRELVASELFGYVEGAFTGAKRGGHPGKFELADGGTIFLDEIGDMPLDTQANLLRVLETKQIVRVGGHHVIPVDVRVVAATHKNLKKEVGLGNFREDLFYRLNVMPIHTPALRERKEDIKGLVDYFIKKFSEHTQKNVKGAHSSFYRAIMQYHWPGNVRELQNVIQLVVNMVPNNKIITINHLPTYMKEGKHVHKEYIAPLMTLEEIEKNAIERTIKVIGGNMVLAAKTLGISRSTLYRKMEKYHIDHVSK